MATMQNTTSTGIDDAGMLNCSAIPLNDPDVEFIVTAGAAAGYRESSTVATPTVAVIGNFVGLFTADSGVTWEIEDGTGSNSEFIITRVLDSNFDDVRHSGGTGAYVVFRYALL
jgi:hypothetical protein